MSVLSHEAIKTKLQALPDWHHRGNAIERVYDCGDFNGSLRFVNAVAAIANAIDHHPDIFVSWNRVTLTVTSHDLGGLTDRDFLFAEKVAAVEPPQTPPKV